MIWEQWYHGVSWGHYEYLSIYLFFLPLIQPLIDSKLLIYLSSWFIICYNKPGTSAEHATITHILYGNRDIPCACASRHILILYFRRQTLDFKSSCIHVSTQQISDFTDPNNKHYFFLSSGPYYIPIHHRMRVEIEILAKRVLVSAICILHQSSSSLQLE